MFDLNSFVRSAISGMIGNEPDYKVREYALGWLDRKVLTDADLEEIDAEITAYNDRPPEPEITEPMVPEIIPPLIEDVDPGMMVEPETPPAEPEQADTPTETPPAAEAETPPAEEGVTE